MDEPANENSTQENKNVESTRFADYFVICGLDLHSGLELDRLAGRFLEIILIKV